ncbi:nickel pincer cofactor biosynthesis protein LarC [Zongyangia hominis]|uniref:Pyridinium-3,5-bisthiocarboxylic acid mononucleotide nickel insertion protein n=1 Tax=Zongyangia hominis TaxID=2763677 RepID=A0A926IAV7_9FIRM|nr:nickel pincer cofactor biosynthesis protein LarC [Zongyangia hominis]MBC8569505.1 nickel pincer cofactor biosynthesis protein LarC [Zongyangia hominis]
MKELYLECQSGISGDMTVAALLDLGADEGVLRRGLASLSVDGYALRISRVKKQGIEAADFDVILEEGEHPHGHVHHVERHIHGQAHSYEAPHGEDVHPHEAAHGHEDHSYEAPHGENIHPYEAAHGHEDHSHGESHSHGEDRLFADGGHHHSHGEEGVHVHAGHEHGHTHPHSHVHRGLADILAIIEGGDLSCRAKALAAKIFHIVAQAESKAHGMPVEEVHFHEVGAVDSIVDIVGAAICLDNLDIGRVWCSPLCEGTGTVRCAHGIMPVPAPATANILAEHHIPVRLTDTEGERVTPTGAAIVAAVTDHFGAPAYMRVKKVGLGAGKRDYPAANLLRAYLIESGEEDAYHDEVEVITTDLDDMTGEQMGYAMERLFAAGAKDVHYTPVFMKKNRPGYCLTVLCAPELHEECIREIFKNTSAIGVRHVLQKRTKMKRDLQDVETKLGNITIKRCEYGEISKETVEYESAKKLADAKNIPLDEVFRVAKSEPLA